MAAASGNYPEADSVAAHDGEEDEDLEEEEDIVDEEEQADEENEVSPDNARDEDEDDDVVEVPDDEEEEEESSEALQQPREAVHQEERDMDEVTSGGEEVSGSIGPSSSSYVAPSSSSSSITAPASPSSSSTRRITPITWDRSASQTDDSLHGARGGSRGRGPYRSSDRIMVRRQQQQQQQGDVPHRGGFGPQRSVRGGQKARRSRQGPM